MGRLVSVHFCTSDGLSLHSVLASYSLCAVPDEQPAPGGMGALPCAVVLPSTAVQHEVGVAVRLASPSLC